MGVSSGEVWTGVGWTQFGSRGPDLGSDFVFFTRLFEIFQQPLSLLGNAVFDVYFPPIPFFTESPLPPNLVYGVILARKGLRLPDLRGFENLMFCLPSPTVYDV